MYEFVICSVFKNETHILDEWVQHYLLHGADHFFLINDFSTDNYLEIINKYKDKITLFHNNIITKKCGRQTLIYEKYFRPILYKSKWVAILDMDEFLYSPYDINIKNIIKSYEPYSQIIISWLMFGSNGHIIQPKKVVDNFTKRDYFNETNFKTIFKSGALINFEIHIHNTNGNNIYLKYDDNVPLIINHYFLQSLDFYIKVKGTRGDMDNWYDTHDLKRDKNNFILNDKNNVEDLRLFNQNNYGTCLKEIFPKDIYLCNKTIDDQTKLFANNWKKLNPDYNIYLYDDTQCEDFLLKEYGQLHLSIFKFIKDGLIKADFWRICILYRYGGFYSDIDNEPLIPLREFLEPNIDFITCSSYWDSKNLNFNPNFIGSYKNNIILEKCIDWYINKYNNYINNNRQYKSFENNEDGLYEWSIMRTFNDVLHLNNYHKNDGLYYFDNDMKIQILKECPGTDHYDSHNIYNNKRIFNNRYSEWDCNTHSFKCNKYSFFDKNLLYTLSLIFIFFIYFIYFIFLYN